MGSIKARLTVVYEKKLSDKGDLEWLQECLDEGDWQAIGEEFDVGGVEHIKTSTLKKVN